MPTAFAATWGSGRPVIGFLGEYDALPGVSQDAVPTRKELERGGTGHGCGHNLLGAGAFAAAIGLKHELEKRNLPGTVKYFGCPAEENFSGKAFMARDGLFNDCDACLTWHAGSVNRVWTGSSLANNAVNVTFHGRTAHAAGDPYNGPQRPGCAAAHEHGGRVSPRAYAPQGPRSLRDNQRGRPA
jgi:aminobenzoyl-glutamate utilization protein B